MLSIVMADVVALVGGLVHSMVPGEAPRLATVLVRDGRIEAVAPELELPPGCERHDVTGMHLVPGLIDAMSHFDAAHDALYLVSGVTVVRDVGGGRVRALLQRAPEARERTPGPTLYTCGAVLDGDPPSSPDAAILRDAHAAEELLPILFDDQVDFLVTHLGLPRTAWERTIELAHEQGLELWGPIPRAVELADAITAGQDGIFYLDRLLPAGTAWAEVLPGDLRANALVLGKAGIPVVPLLQATAARLDDQRDSQALLLPLLGPDYESWWTTELRERLTAESELNRQVGAAVLEKQRALLALLHELGLPLVPGSGTPHPWLFPGQSLHQELAQWVAAGLPAAEVLRLVTYGSAQALGIADRHGSIAPGKVADIVVVAADPRDDIGTLQSPTLVMQRGRVFTVDDLDDLLATLVSAQAAVRSATDVPLEFVQPPHPAGAVVLSGVVESRTLDRRIAVESFAVIQEPNGMVSYCGRIRYPGDEEMTVEQRITDGQLEDFRIHAKVGGREILCEGVWVAGRMRLRRTLDGVVLDTRAIPRRPVCLDVASVTSLLVVGQQELSAPFPVLSFHELLEPEPVEWSLALNDKGDHTVRTQAGAMAFRFDERGAPLLHRSKVGRAVIETRLVQAEVFGGAGHPLPAGKRTAPAEPATEPVEAGAPGGAAEGGGS